MRLLADHKPTHLLVKWIRYTDKIYPAPSSTHPRICQMIHLLVTVLEPIRIIVVTDCRHRTCNFQFIFSNQRVKTSTNGPDDSLSHQPTVHILILLSSFCQYPAAKTHVPEDRLRFLLTGLLYSRCASRDEYPSASKVLPKML